MEVHEYPLDTSVCYTSGDSPKRCRNLHARKSLSQFRSDVSDRFFFFSPFFCPDRTSAEDYSRTEIAITAVRFARHNVAVLVRLLSSSIDTVSSDSRRIYVPSRE